MGVGVVLVGGVGAMVGGEGSGFFGEGLGESYQNEVSGAVLYCVEDVQDDGYDVQEVGEDGSLLVVQEVKDLSLQRGYLWGRAG